MKKLLVYIFLLVICQECFSQTDTSFWFAAPDISSASNYDRPVILRLTSYSQSSIVVVSQPANAAFPVQTIFIPANTTQSLDLTAWINMIECGPGDVIQNKGLKIQSNNKISVYYEVNLGGPNQEFFVLKGNNALGTQFYISSQFVVSNSNAYTPLPLSSFNIVATEDNTAINITPRMGITGHLAGTPFLIVLNKGQTYAAIATSQTSTSHLHGSYVSSNKPIAITLADDLLGGACQDLIGDQTIPISGLGTEYIAIKGDLTNPGERVFVTATQNATTVKRNGIIVATINTGETADVFLNNNAEYIETTYPSYVYQLTGVSCELASSILPKLNCTGSSSVSFVRTTSEIAKVLLLVKNGGQGNFLINNVAGVIMPSDFTVVAGTLGQWFTAKISLSSTSYPLNSVIKISNSSSLFQLGYLQATSFGAGYGYFSDYNSITASASASNTLPCTGSNVTLNAANVPSAVYSWTGPGGFISSSSNPVLNNVTNTSSGTYVVNVTVPGCGIYIDSVIINVLPKSFTTINQIICEGQTFAGYNVTGQYINTFTGVNGCDSVRTLNLTVKPKSFSTINQIICEGETFQGYTVSGTFLNTFVAANGCDSIRTLNLTVKPKSFTTINQIICEGQIFLGYSVSGTFLNTFVAANGCDSIRTLNLTVKPKSFSTINASICTGGNYGGYTTAGTYVNTFTAANGCDSIRTLNLTVNPATSATVNQIICEGQTFAGYNVTGQYINTFTGVNGCDSVRTLNLTVKPKSFSTINQIICEGETFQGYSVSGTFLNTFVAANGCDSIRTLNLTVKPKSFTTINQIICEGETFQGYSVSGTYLNTFVAANGCDSVRTLNLTVKPKSSSTINASICTGGNYGGYTTAGTFINTFTAANGCDSIRTLNLTVNSATSATINQIICEGQTFAGYSVTGQYINTFTGANGCDSLRTLNLTVKPKSFSTINQIICEGETFQGYSVSGTFLNTFVAANGCDSIRTLNLTVKPKSFTTINQIICEGETFQGYSVSGTYLNTFVAANGCDSIRTLNLTVNPKSFSTINASICTGGNYGGYTTAGTYVNTFSAANGCDSIRTLNLTVNPTTSSTITQSICEGETYAGYSVAGQYINTFAGVNGCDSVRTLNLTVKPKSYKTINQTICEGQSFEGYTTTGTYLNTFVATNGCDSIRTLNLTINPKSAFTLNKTICEVEIFEGHNSTGTFTNTYTGVNGCDSVRILKLTVLKLPKPNLGADTSICFENNFLISPGSFNNYLWQDGSVQNSYSVHAPGLYTVKITNTCGAATDSIQVTEKSCEIFFPNVFTPNSDTKNDVFRILNADNISNYSLSVYNRWGEKVFQTTEVNMGWDGKYKGQPSESGVYIWICTFKKGISDKNVKGSVILLR